MPPVRETTKPRPPVLVVLIVLVLTGCGSAEKPADNRAAVRWSRLVSLVKECKVKRVDQTHSDVVTVTRLDGQQEWGFEPRIDAIIPIVNRANARCGAITFSTE
jgi:hypothetical protein